MLRAAKARASDAVAKEAASSMAKLCSAAATRGANAATRAALALRMAAPVARQFSLSGPTAVWTYVAWVYGGGDALAAALALAA